MAYRREVTSLKNEVNKTLGLFDEEIKRWEEEKSDTPQCLIDLMIESKKAAEFLMSKMKDKDQKQMDLQDTIELMTSDDYKARFAAEYWQTDIRAAKLAEFLDKYKAGTLEFEPATSYDTYHQQLVYMEDYLSVLEERALNEDIDLNKYVPNKE